ncbi:MAG: Flp pilus assembly complex ATPase component TadA [Burkholderiaceae bacterium]|nr:Flp pilus assembly complex ATPase component TadA [Microbacteriaceae bacterium]
MTSLVEILILRGLLPLEQLSPVGTTAISDEVMARELVSSGVISELQLARARAEQAGLPFLELTDYPVDRDALSLISAAMCRRHEVLPLAIRDGRLIVAMTTPGDVFALDDVREAAKMPFAPAVVERSDLLSAIVRFHRSDDELANLTTRLSDELAPATTYSAADESTDSSAPIVRFVNLIINQAIQDRASDIHIEPGEHNLRVRYRIDGVLHEIRSAPSKIQNSVISRLKIMSDIDIAERRIPQDGRMTVHHGGRDIDLRVAVLPTVWGEKIVLRILDNAPSSMSITDLDFGAGNLREFTRAYSKPYGMILVTGPTGSGKSTTLYTALNMVANPGINVITVEDPVEYRMPGINQVQVNRKAGLSFAVALRSILRSDPDVVLLGEIRDQETAKIAVEASLTGHLVLSTLHTNDAPSAVTRLVEMGIEPFLVGSALECVVAQRLVRRLCARCKVPDLRTVEQLAAVGFERGVAGGATVFSPVGCVACSQTGYTGRVAVHEVMTMSPKLELLTVSQASSAEIAAAARAEGMVTLREDGWAKVGAGLTSVEEIIRVIA